MKSSTVVSLTILFLALWLSIGNAQWRQAPLPESKVNTIGYPDVATARKALLARHDVHSYVENGWLIVVVPTEKTVWSFTPKTDPAYPAAVKRIVVEQNGETFLQLNVLCEASKAACDKLVQQFRQLDKKVSGSIGPQTN